MVLVSPLCYPEVIKYLKETGRTVNIIEEAPLGRGVGAHPDLRVCRLGGNKNESALLCDVSELGNNYPDNAKFCAVFLDKYMIHRLNITHPNLLCAAKKRGLKCANVRQGYTKCSVIVVNGRAIITSDDGIYNAVSGLPDVEVLKVAPGYVSLPEFKNGFIGGASGRVGQEIVFNGDISVHPDYERIKMFIERHGLLLRYFSDLPLKDVGSIIEYDHLIVRI